jgi:Zn-dependent M16 (insulinase) family peptidase
MPLNPAFELLREQSIDSLNIVAQEYRHLKTGAVHLHLQSDHDENVFMVALRTVPVDSTGVAHILEHTALCGSEKYPVRDPFFMMIRRSLNTFMNAFTSSDWTAYPFASENKKDFFNLLDVYLDAVFFTKLDLLDFKQEGHRVEFEEPNNPASALVYKGVVFNEMKGALSSPIQKLWADLTHELFQTSTYHHNSGGDPKHIVDLTYDGLKAFYKTHYHPSNAMFMTFGNTPVDSIHQRMEDNVLSRFEASDKPVIIHPEQRWDAPKKATGRYVAEAGETDKKTHVVMGWLLGESANLVEQLEAHLLSNILLENSASPLRKALEQSDYGMAPSPLCGLEDTSREMVFVCGLEGTDAEHAEAIETLILSTLNQVVADGVPLDNVEAVLHQLELSQREIGGGHYPYGLQLMLGCLPATVHRGDPMALLDIDPVINELRIKIKDPCYITGLITKLLVDNPHRLQYVMTPDSELAAAEEMAEKRRLEDIKQSLSEDDRAQIVAQAKALTDRQAQVDDPDILPKVTLKDVPSDIHTVSPVLETPAHTQYTAGTNGLTYLQIVCNLPKFTDEELQVLPLFSSLLTELGVGEHDYLAIQEQQTACTGGLSGWLSYKADLTDTRVLQGNFVLSGKALNRNQAELEDLMHRTLFSLRLDERDRIFDLVSQIRVRKEQSVTGNGHGLAMLAASAYWSPGIAVNNRLSGIASIQSVRKLHDSLKTPAAFDHFITLLTRIRDKIIASDKHTLLITDSQTPLIKPAFDAPLEGNLHPLQGLADSGRNVAWITNTQVNFCAKAYATVSPSHPDSAALTVLAGLLRNGYLHRAIREQGGAYGGGASHDATHGVFRFYSYRDPRLTDTLSDFDQALQWCIDTDISEQMLEESILGIISSMDKPGSPAGEAKQDFHNKRFGRTEAQQRAYRKAILETNAQDLKRVCSDWLLNKPSSVAVVTDQGHSDEAIGAGLSILKL